jgi:hypothetical protein
VRDIHEPALDFGVDAHSIAVNGICDRIEFYRAVVFVREEFGNS